MFCNFQLEYTIKTLGRSRDSQIQCDAYNNILQQLHNYIPDIT